MRRRRQKNPLLKRIILISVGVHILVLPVLAHFNAFQKIQKGLVQVQMVVLPPPDHVQAKAEEKLKQAPQKRTQSARSANRGSHAHQGPIRIAKNSPHIAVASGSGSEEGDEGTAVQGNGGQGVVPPNTGEKGQATNKAEGNPLPVVKPAPAPEPKPTPQPTPPTPQPVKPPMPVPPTPVPVPSVKEAVFTEATPIGEQPDLNIPEELRTEALDKTFVAECVVTAEGKTTEIKRTQSTGNEELDRRAMQAAMRWRFKPATKDGVAVESRVRLHIQFQVN